MTTRADLAAALSTVDGVTGMDAPPVSPMAGDAWPVWARSELAALARGWVSTWDVWVVLPAASTVDTISAGDPLIDAVGNALAHLGAVLGVEPGRVLAQASTPNAVPALHFTMETY